MTRGEPKQNILRRYLQDAIAAEHNFGTQLNSMSGENDNMAARLLFAQHAEETRSQHRKLKTRLEALGGSPSGLKTAMAHFLQCDP